MRSPTRILASTTSAGDDQARRRMLARTVLVVWGVASLILSGCGGNGHDNASQGASTRSADHSRTPAAKPPGGQSGRLVFRRYLTGDVETSGALYTSGTDGSGEHRLTSASAIVLVGQPDWAPDARHVLFTRTKLADTDAESRQLVVVASNGNGLTPLTRGCPARPNFVCGFDDAGVFSSDGRSIAFVHASGNVRNERVRHADVFIMDSHGKHRRQVTRSRSYAGAVDGVQWSPNGKQLVYGRSNAASSKPEGGRALFILNADGTRQRRLTPWSLGANGIPDWSPATNLIVFRAVRSGMDEESGVGNFFTIRPDGTGLTQITHFANTVIGHRVSFSPDGQWIVFPKHSTLDPNAEIFVAKTDGRSLQRVTKTPQSEGAPDWAPTP
jgi:Tol biopolymer transport system component